MFTILCIFICPFRSNWDVALLRDGVNLSAVPKKATSPEPDPRRGYGF